MSWLARAIAAVLPLSADGGAGADVMDFVVCAVVADVPSLGKNEEGGGEED